MSGETPAEEWEQAFGADLRPHLVPAGRPGAARQPIDRVCGECQGQVAQAKRGGTGLGWRPGGKSGDHAAFALS